MLLLLVAATGLLQLKANGVAQTDVILTASNAVGRAGCPGPALRRRVRQPRGDRGRRGKRQDVLAKLQTSDGVGDAYLLAEGGAPVITGAPGAPAAPAIRDGKVLIDATLNDAADSAEAENAVVSLRQDLKKIDSGVLVGGVTATALDTNTTAQRDLVTIIPVVLGVILVILMLLLRSVLAPVLLVAHRGAVLCRGDGRLRLRVQRCLRLPRRGRDGAPVRLRLPRGTGRRLQHLPDDPGPGGVPASTAPGPASCAAS